MQFTIRIRAYLPINKSTDIGTFVFRCLYITEHWISSLTLYLYINVEI